MINIYKYDFERNELFLIFIKQHIKKVNKSIFNLINFEYKRNTMFTLWKPLTQLMMFFNLIKLEPKLNTTLNTCGPDKVNQDLLETFNDTKGCLMYRNNNSKVEELNVSLFINYTSYNDLTTPVEKEGYGLVQFPTYVTDKLKFVYDEEKEIYKSMSLRLFNMFNSPSEKFTNILNEYLSKNSGLVGAKVLTVTFFQNFFIFGDIHTDFSGSEKKNHLLTLWVPLDSVVTCCPLGIAVNGTVNMFPHMKLGTAIIMNTQTRHVSLCSGLP